MNFLKHTKEEIKDCKKSVADIDFIGSNDGQYEMNWKEFCDLADNFFSGGLNNPPADLIFIFKDTSRLYLIYDQVEELCWEYMPIFTRRDHPKKIKNFDKGELVRELWKELR